MPTKPESTAPDPATTSSTPLVRMRDTEVHFQLQGSTLARLLGRDTGSVKAVDGVTLDIGKGEVLGIVGESGSGKSTLGRSLLGLAPVTAGTVHYGEHSIGEMKERQLRDIRQELQMIFQDPSAALNPAMDIETSIGHPLKIHKMASGAQLRRRVIDTLERVGLSPGEQFLKKYPNDLSGGQKQRAVIARAIIMDPQLLVADEPISMLDMSVRSKILKLMLDLKADLDLTYVYITHDLASAKFFCDRIAIMYLGRVVEIGTTEEIFADPKHPYTKSLVAAIPDLDPEHGGPREVPRGEIPDAADPPLGCAFHPRCPVAVAECGWESRDLRTVLETHWLEVPETEFEAERAIVGDIESLDRPSHEVLVPAGRGSTGEDVAAFLERIRESQPDEPMWRGVHAIQAESSGARVTYTEGKDPALRPAGAVAVACHLFAEPAADAKPQFDPW